MSSARASLGSATADPGAIGLSLFGFALFLYGVQFVVCAGAAPGAATSSVATIYAVLVAAAGWYAIALIVPVAFMAIPSVMHRNVPLTIAFVALIGLLLFLGTGFLSANLAAKPPVPPSVNELRVSGIFAFIAAAALWFRAMGIVLAIGKGQASHEATPAPAGLSSPVTSN